MDDAMLKKMLGAEIRRRRNAAGLSQQEFAQSIGMNRTRIREIERGEGNPQLNTLLRIASGLGTTLQKIFSSISD
ncbi:helix-turn-helix domain-containing protein [Eggerthella sp. HF-4214]|uniref:Helix-turn-helix domain-containing protein n=2 Tax=Eggerthella guodeyinii TaxID=2690837 RepID=A0A6N7RK91_9ACTN|nr:helix-turn-helix domain-containing protein [Eggerthella guodeyinii]